MSNEFDCSKYEAMTLDDPKSFYMVDLPASFVANELRAHSSKSQPSKRAKLLNFFKLLAIGYPVVKR